MEEKIDKILIISLIIFIGLFILSMIGMIWGPFAFWGKMAATWAMPMVLLWIIVANRD